MTNNEVNQLQPGQLCRMMISGRKLKVVRVVKTDKKQFVECLDVTDEEKPLAFVVWPDQYGMMEVLK